MMCAKLYSVLFVTRTLHGVLVFAALRACLRTWIQKKYTQQALYWITEV